MGDLLPFLPNIKTVRRLAAKEVENMKEIYRITAGYADPLPPSEEARELFEAGELEEAPWRHE